MESKTIIKIVAGIIIVVGIVGISFGIYNTSRTSINSSVNQFNQLTAQYDNITYSQYENGTAKGEEIVRLITGLTTSGDGVSIVVKTKMDTAGTTYSATGTTSVVTDKSSDKYINPNGMFDCAITRNNNGVITSITFTQK